MVIKCPIGDFGSGIGSFGIGNWGFKSPITNPKNTDPQFKITNWQFYHRLVTFTFSSLLRKFINDDKGDKTNDNCDDQPEESKPDHPGAAGQCSWGVTGSVLCVAGGKLVVYSV